MRELPRILTQWFGAALEAYKLKTRKDFVEPDVTLAIHQACERGFAAVSGAPDKQEEALKIALADDPLQDVVLAAYTSATSRSSLLGLYVR